MIDWHSHILPCIDDGSKSVEESLEMLKIEKHQGVDTVIATPHFFANDNSVEEFLQKRKESLDMLNRANDGALPEILCGAEVKYYQGISKMEGLNSLTIGDTELLLLEMSMMKWTEYTVSELVQLAGSGNFKIILAHIERYLNLQSRDVWQRLYESGILMQVNASFFTGFSSRRKAINLLKSGSIDAIGSDCHNCTSRPPGLLKAYTYIEKKLGSDFVLQFNEYSSSLLKK